MGREVGYWIDKKINGFSIQKVPDTTTSLKNNALPGNKNFDNNYLNTKRKIMALLPLRPLEDATPATSGSQGKVSKWCDKQNETKTFAVKILTPTPTNAQWFTLFKGEITALGLNGHPNIISPKYVVLRNKNDDEYHIVSNKSEIPTENKDEYQVMAVISDWIEGKDLFEQSLSSSPATAIRASCADMATALDVIHSKGLIHRDLKKENIMKTENGFVLIDFGLARQLTGQQPATSCGSYETAPPEMFSNHADEKYDTGVDLWKLGLLALDLATHGTPDRYDQYSGYATTVNKIKHHVMSRTNLTTEEKQQQQQQQQQIAQEIAFSNVHQFNSLTDEQRKSYITQEYGECFDNEPELLDLICNFLKHKENRISLEQAKERLLSMRSALEVASESDPPEKENLTG